MMLFEGRKAIVTGGLSGIGRATAVRLAAEGATGAVKFHADKEAGDAGAVVERVKNAGGDAIAAQADVGSEIATPMSLYWRFV